MDIYQILKSYFGYDTFRPQQEEIIRHVLAGKDALVLMSTGGGKSLCYQVPALALSDTTLVVSPLISLMKDQVDALHSNGIPAAALNSSNSDEEKRTIQYDCASGRVKILYVSPEYLVKNMPWFQTSVKVSLIAIDEAHCISQWGHDFRPDYNQLHALHEQLPGVPILALTATADKVTRDDIIEQLHLRDNSVFISSFDRPNLSLAVKRDYTKEDKLREICEVIHRHTGESGIIYCLTKKTTEKLANQLRDKGIIAEAYHGDLSKDERSRIQDDFSYDRVSVVCATIAFGMGIDKSNVRFVIHYNLPKNIEGYYQEIGRGGRDGLPTETILFYNLQDVITLRKFADDSGQKSLNREKLKRMQEYAEARVCRRRILLNYFGESTICNCGNCDICLNPPASFDGTALVQKALSAIRQTNEQIGFTTTIEILRGKASDTITQNGYNRLETFGAGSDVSSNDWRDYLIQILQSGYIEMDYKDNFHLRVTALGEAVLYGRTTAELSLAEQTSKTELSYLEMYKPTKHKRLPIIKADSEDLVLSKKLRELRLHLSKEMKVPPFIVFDDKTLRALATEMPTTLTDFGKTYGIGEYKCKMLGPTFIKLIGDYVATLPSPQGQATNAPQTQEDTSQTSKPELSNIEKQRQKYPEAYKPWTPENDQLLLKLDAEGKTKKELAEIFQRKRSAIKARLNKLKGK